MAVEMETFTMSNKKRANEEEDEFSWNELPLEVQSNVLGWLSLRHLFRSKGVCKLWNSIISSPSFIHFPSRLTCSGNRPWLIFYSPKNFEFLLAFDFDGDSWFKYDVRFLSSMLDAFHVRTSASPPSAQRTFVWCSGTASGFLLLDSFSSLHVCNPLTKSLVNLPPFKCIEVIVAQGFSTSTIKGISPPVKTCDSTSITNHAVKGFLPTDDRHSGINVTNWHMRAAEIKGKDEAASCQARHPCLWPHNYTVVVIGKAKAELVIEAYALHRNSWVIAGTIPTDFIIRHDQMTECNGAFYSLLLNPMGMLVVGESNDAGTACWRIQTMPFNYRGELCRLLACRNSLFMVCPFDVCFGFVIWRYETNSRDWIKLRDMPDYILEEVKSLSYSNWVDCVGVGDFICFRALGTLKVLTYNLCNELWSWLPELSVAYDTVLARGLQFEPRLDYTQFL